jgi:NADH:ubiquinone oxidoreductase subunit 4 (subunit M)
MSSEYLALGIFVFYFLYKSYWLFKRYFIDKSENDKDNSVGKAYSKETVMMLLIALMVLWLGSTFDF